MEKSEFARLESLCQRRFMEAGNYFHVCSQENHPVLFHNEEEFKAAMNIVALAAFLFPDLQIYTFEIMDNHFHFAVSGDKTLVDDFNHTLTARLSSHPFLAASQHDIRHLVFKIFEISDLDNLRNVIAYINRNGAVIGPDENVFSYRWGANRFFFNREAKLRYAQCGLGTTIRERRLLFRSAKLDGITGAVSLDGYISPMCFCKVNEAESFFRNSRHYFQSISRNIETSKEIAKFIGESIFYTDEDLYSHIRALCSRKFSCPSIAVLPKEAKIELARELHFDYNAGNKQICRLLKLDMSVVSALFPSYP